MSKPVLVANGQGFWGDSILGPVRLVKEGPLDYLALDYLAEVTMSIMQKLKQRDPEAGYATDFLQMLDRILPDLVEKDIKIVANAGGVNPHACKDAVLEVIKKHGKSGIKVAVVEGDDVMDQLDDLMAAGEAFENMAERVPIDSVTSFVEDLVGADAAVDGEWRVTVASSGACQVITGVTLSVAGAYVVPD